MTEPEPGPCRPCRPSGWWRTGLRSSIACRRDTEPGFEAFGADACREREEEELLMLLLVEVVEAAAS